MNRSLLFLQALVLAVLPCATPAQAQEEVRTLVLFAQCSDLAFEHSRSDHEGLCASMSAYFNDQYHGGKSFLFEPGPQVLLPQSFRFYGRNTVDRRDAQLHELVVDACQEADETVNFARYDNDGDGAVDGVLILLPGRSEPDGAGEDYFWPQHASLADRNVSLSLDGKKILAYATACECDKEGAFTGIGDLAHEFGHILGLPDLYDTDAEGSGGTCRGLWGTLSLMDRGNASDGGHTPPNLCAADLQTLGIGRPEPLQKKGDYQLEPLSENGRYYIIETPTQDESFLLECRKAEGRDLFLGGEGLLITHVDRSRNDSWYSDYYRRNLLASERWSLNQVNCRPDRPCAAPLPALPNATDVAQVFFPQEGHDAIGSETDPALRCWNGRSLRWALSDIRRQSDGSISFHFYEPLTLRLEAAYQDAAVASWTVDERLLPLSSVSLECTAEGEEPLLFHPESGERSLRMEGLQPRKHYCLTLRVNGAGGAHSLSADFDTRPYRTGLYPFIVLPTEGRDERGCFAAGTRLTLQAFNAVDAQEVHWYFNGTPIVPDSDGTFTLSASGRLRAELLYADGSVDLIEKEVTVQ